MTQPLDTLAEATYEDLPFPVSALSVEGGHDFAEHTAYLRRGADMEPCGQKPYKGSFTIPCVDTPQLIARYGPLFRPLREALVTLFESAPIGTLTLPGYDAFTAAITGWTGELSPDNRNGVDLKVTFTEHNGSASLLTTPWSATPANTPATVATKAASTDAAMAAVSATGWAATTATITTQLAALEAAALPYTAVAECFRLMLAPITSNLALALFAPASAHAAVVELLALQAAVYDLRSRYSPTLSQVRLYTVPRTMALWEVAQSVYQDASLTTLLRAANSIPDCLFVAQGTVLTVLPKP